MTDGQKIYEALLSVRRFHQQIASLLQTGEGLLIEKGFEPLIASQAIAELSYAINASSSWMPEVVFRWLSTPGHPDVATFLSVIMCPRKVHPNVPPIGEPLVSIGWIRFASPLGDNFHPKWLAGHAMWTDIPRDGSWHHTGPYSPGPANGVEWAMMARPLVEVPNCAELGCVIGLLLEHMPSAVRATDETTPDVEVTRVTA